MAVKLNFQTVPLSEIRLTATQQQGAPQPVVLVVDDEQIIADTLAAILSKSGYTALTAYDGAAALETADLIPPQMMITDVGMPGMSGIELAIAIRKAIPDCKVLLFSGQASTAELLEIARDAGYEFEALSKPIHPTELLARISKCLTGPVRDTPESWSFLRRAQRDARTA
jgi:DNA-binding response OmpR family regulator